MFVYVELLGCYIDRSTIKHLYAFVLPMQLCHNTKILEWDPYNLKDHIAACMFKSTRIDRKEAEGMNFL